jgi:hypothetical protein
VESKWKNYHFFTFPEWSFSKNKIYTRCFLWIQNNLEITAAPFGFPWGIVAGRNIIMQRKGDGTSQIQNWNVELGTFI